jgi:branched-chain amino acid transport system permease protein
VDPSIFFEQLINGLTIGGVYALVALGYTLVYGILTMINFAHGEVLMLGAFSGYWTLSLLEEKGILWNWPFSSAALAFLMAILVCSMVGACLERFAYRPLRSAPRLAPLISAIGASIFLQNLIMVLVKGRMRVYPDIVPLSGFHLGGVFVGYFQLLLLGVSIGLMVALTFVIKKTKVGIAMRAVAEDKKASYLMGINVDGIIQFTFIVGSALAAVAGVLVGMYYSQINHMMGFIPGIKAFTAAVVGGIGNITGAMLGGFVLGLLESFSVNILPAQYKDVVAFAILVMVLVFRPKGILGEVVSEKV